MTHKRQDQKTDRPTDRPTNRKTDRRTDQVIGNLNCQLLGELGEYGKGQSEEEGRFKACFAYIMIHPIMNKTPLTSIYLTIVLITKLETDKL